MVYRIDRPSLRGVEIFPVGEAETGMFAIRDPEGVSETIVVSMAAALLASLMNGRRDLASLQDAFAQQTGRRPATEEVEKFIADLDQALMLNSPRFAEHWRKETSEYLASSVRPAAHAGGAYAGEPAELREQLDRLFSPPEGPGAIEEAAIPKRALCGVLSPHIDLHRGGPAFAWAYRKLVEESDASVFIIFGTAHSAMHQLYSVSRKDYDTPLGKVSANQDFVNRLVARVEETEGEGASARLFEDELAHRHEHSIEFQAVFLQHLLGARRPFTIVPILVGSFHHYVESGQLPAQSARVSAFTSALREVAASYPEATCFISGGDLAHVGRRFGDADELLAEHLDEQQSDDKALLSHACRGDSKAFFRHVAEQGDRRRICGLSPTYTLMEVARPTHGELLKYSQAVERDGSACVSFASLAFYR